MDIYYCLEYIFRVKNCTANYFIHKIPLSCLIKEALIKIRKVNPYREDRHLSLHTGNELIMTVPHSKTNVCLCLCGCIFTTTTMR